MGRLRLGWAALLKATPESEEGVEEMGVEVAGASFKACCLPSADKPFTVVACKVFGLETGKRLATAADIRESVGRGRLSNGPGAKAARAGDETGVLPPAIWGGGGGSDAILSKGVSSPILPFAAGMAGAADMGGKPTEGFAALEPGCWFMSQ